MYNKLMVFEIIYLILFAMCGVLLGSQLLQLFFKIKENHQIIKDNRKYLKFIDDMEDKREVMKSFCNLLREHRLMTEQQSWTVQMNYLAKQQLAYQEKMAELRAKANISP